MRIRSKRPWRGLAGIFHEDSVILPNSARLALPQLHPSRYPRGRPGVPSLAHPRLLSTPSPEVEQRANLLATGGPKRSTAGSLTHAQDGRLGVPPKARGGASCPGSLPVPLLPCSSTLSSSDQWDLRPRPWRLGPRPWKRAAAKASPAS